MSKKAWWFTAAGLAIVIAAILVAYLTQRRPSQDLTKVVTQQALPGVADYLSKLTGRPVKITYQGLAMTDEGLTLSRVKIAAAASPTPAITIEQAVFTRLEQVLGQRPHWLVSGRLVGLAGGLDPSASLKAARVEFSQLRLSPGLVLVTVEQGEVSGFERKANGRRLTLAGLRVKRLQVSRGGSLALASGQADQVQYQAGPATLRLASLAVLGARARDLRRLSPFDAARTELTGLAALQAGRQFLGLAKAKVQYDRQSPLHKLSVDLQGLSLKQQGAPADMAAYMAGLGYQDVALNLRLAAEVDLQSQRLLLRELALDSPQMGSLQLGLELSGFRIDPAKLSRMPLWSLLLAQRSVALVAAKLTYRDASLAGRLLADQARRGGMSTQDFTKELIARIAAAARDLGPGVDSLAAALTTFLRQPGQLQVSLSPAQPLGLLGIALLKPREVAERLGITAQAH